MKLALLRRSVVLVFLLVVVMAGRAYALQITSPHDGDSFREGDVVHFVAELSATDTEVAYVRLIVSRISVPESCMKEIRTHPIYECYFTIPPGSPRVLKLGAHIVSSVPVVEAPYITINVALSQSAVLQSLKAVGGNTIFLRGPNLAEYSIEQLLIMGAYSDGHDRNLTLGSTGTTYVSSKPNIVTVNSDGLVTAVATGQAEITVTNSGKTLIINAIVTP